MARKSKERDMTTGVIWKELLVFFFPIMAGTLFQQLYNAVDAIIVGKFVGTGALAAVGGSPAVIVNLVVSVFVSLTTGSSVIISQYYGAGNEKELKKATGTTVTFFTLLGVLLSLVCIPFTDTFLRALSTPEDTMADASVYMKIFFTSGPVLLLLNAESGLLRAIGDSRSPFLFMLATCICNIFLDLLFVIVFKMGVAGAAWATVISMVLNMLLATIKLLRSKEAYRLDLHYLGIDRPMLADMMRIGIPSSISGAMYGVSNMILQASVNLLGTTVVASWALSGKVDGIYWATSGAFGSAVTTFIGQNYGARKMDRVHDCVSTSFKIFEPVTLILCAGILLPARFLLPIFSDDPLVQATTWEILLYFVPFYWVWTVIELLSGTMRGCGVVKVPVAISAIGVCLFRVIWVSTICRNHLTLFNVSICYGITWVITAIAMIIYFLHWKKSFLPQNRDQA